MSELTAYDKLAVLMVIEEKIFRICEPLRGLKGKPLNSDAYDNVRRAEKELRKAQPDLILDISIRGHCDETPHYMVDKMMEKEFPSDAMADSESDCIFIYCNSAIKNEVLAFLRSNFGDIHVNAEKNRNILVQGLGNWDDAIAWVNQRGLQEHVRIDEKIRKAILKRFDALIREKKEKFDAKVAELNELREKI